MSLGPTRAAIAAFTALTVASGCAVTSGDVPDGQALYAAHCLGCHQADGRGVPGMQPPIVGGPWVSGDAVSLAVYVITGGFDSAGRSVGAGANVMPAFRHVDDEALAATLTYVRSVFADDAGPVTPAQVRTARQMAPH